MIPDINKLDLLNEEKRVRTLLRTPEGRQALRNVTGLPCFTQDEIEERSKSMPRVLLLCPSKDQPRKETSGALFQMQEHIHRGQYCQLVMRPGINSSVVHWVRNDLLVNVYRDKIDFDYVLFMDDDMVPHPDSLEKLLSHKVDIIGAACTLRQDPPLPNFRTFDKETSEFHTAAIWTDMRGKGGLTQIAGVGTGMMLITRKALDEIGEYYLSCRHEREFFGMPEDLAATISARRRERLEKGFNKWWFEFLKKPTGDGEYGEDLSFCFKAMQVGIPVYLDTSVQPGHIGPHPFSIRDYLAWTPDAREEDMQGRACFQAPAMDLSKELEEVTV